MIREDYGAKFKDVYVQNIIDVADAYRKDIVPGTQAIICGFTTHAQATSKPAQPMTMRGGMKTPYKVFTVPIAELQPMSGFHPFFDALVNARGG